ncbi:MAG: hypothetical protein ABEI06_07935 [Halobacteriaceae archaeon]
MSDRCDICGCDVPIAGGIANFWTLEHTETGGITLELEDGTEWFLCYECIRDLPDNPTKEDVHKLQSQYSESSSD